MEWDLLFKIILGAIATEAITEILTKAEITKPFREFLFDRKENKFFNWLHELFDCGYCTSVWVAAFVVFSYYLIAIKWGHETFVSLFYVSFIIHRVANIFHNIYDRMNEF